ncbi:MAG: xylulokinase [Chitinophagaceae bacterium]
MLLLGIDIGTSFVKVSVVDPDTRKCLGSARFPDKESAIISLYPGWAEQSPGQWWEDVRQAILTCHATGRYNPADIAAIGISYQMHGLVMTDVKQQVIRNSIIWCDSRAVSVGDKAFREIGSERCLSRLLNSPGNFTASKLAWVKEHEPAQYARLDKVMLPGDFISMKFTGDLTTTPSALSEGIFWDFLENSISEDVCGLFGFDKNIFPVIKPVFSVHGYLMKMVADMLGLPPGIPVTYKAGDQLNNALALNVLQPGEVAATAGTSGVIYAVSGERVYDNESRVNSFAHVNHSELQTRIGVLLCINGCGIANRWVRDQVGAERTYTQMNEAAALVAAGSEGLRVIPFGNGSERMLGNRQTGAGILNLDYNIHSAGHIFRAVQEGIAFAFRYGTDILKENRIIPSVVRAGKANMFLSDVFIEAFVNSTGIPVELYEEDGSIGAALGAGIGAGIYHSAAEAFSNRSPIRFVEPTEKTIYNDLYENWKETLLNACLKPADDVNAK